MSTALLLQALLLAVGNRIAQPTTNSYNNTGLTASTIYYYKVAAVDNASNIGTYSTQATGTTQAAGISPSLQLHLDGNFTDSSTNNFTITANANANGFLGSGQFGSNSWRCNYPTAGSDFLLRTDTANLRLDTTVGFSISVWVYPVTSYTGSTRKTIVEKRDDASNMFTLQIEPTSLLVHFQVKEAGTDYKRVTATGLTINAWNHVAATFDSSSNTIAVYKAAVAGNSSSAATQYDATNTDFRIGASVADITNTRIQGYIDEVQYFKGVVLTSTQVTNLMNTNDT